jgi:hypothetical protein
MSPVTSDDDQTGAAPARVLDDRRERSAEL